MAEAEDRALFPDPPPLAAKKISRARGRRRASISLGKYTPRFLILLILVVFAGWIAQPARPADDSSLKRYEASASLMGSVYTVAAYGEERGPMASAVQAAFEEARRIDNLLSNYKPESELSRINRLAAQGSVRVSPEMVRLLERCLEYSRLSNGAFDITVGPLMRVWGFYKGSGRIPGSWALARVRRRVGYRHIDLDTEEGTVRFRRAGVELDPGGIGKGYAVDRMIAVLRKAKLTSAFVSAGGSSIYALGAPPDEPRGWYVRIRDPKNADKTAEELYLKDQSLSTSGSYEKFFEAEGKIYSHIMDPRTGMPAEDVVAVSVLAPSTLDSEAWTKICYVNGLEWTKTHKPNDFRVFMCWDDRPCQWVDALR